MTHLSTDHQAEADHKTHLSILDQVSGAITAVSTVRIAAHKTGKVLDRDRVHKGAHSNQETISKTDSMETKEVVTMGVTQTGLNRGEGP